MLSISTKKTDSAKIAKNAEKYIKKNFNKGIYEKVRSFILEAEKARERVVLADYSNPDKANQNLQNLTTYYRFVNVLEAKLPLSSAGIKFTWYDSLTKRKKLDSSYLLEKVGVLYNIGALYSQLGAETSLEAPDGHKTVMNYYQTAAGWFDEVRKFSLDMREVQMIDVSPEHISFMINILIGQAYYCMYDKLFKSSGSKPNLAKLAITMSRNFRKSYDVSKDNVLYKHIGEEIRNILYFQYLLFYSASQYWLSFEDREKGSQTGDGFGKGVARLKKALESIEKAMRVKGIRGRYLENGRTYLQMIRSEKENAEKENLSIYMDSIPDPNTLEEAEEITRLVPQFPKSIDIHSKIEGQECMNELVPPSVLAAMAEYKELLNQILVRETEKVNYISDQLYETMSNMGLPTKLEATVGGKGLPDSLWKKILQNQSQGGVNYVNQGLQNLDNFSANNERFANELLNSLTQEENEDNTLRQMYGHNWSRPQSSALNIHFKNDISTLKTKLAQAKEVDQESKNRWESNQESLQLLGKSKREIEALIPERNTQTQSSTTYEELNNAIENVETVNKELFDEVARLKTALEQENIIEEIIKMEELKIPKEQVFEKEMSKFEESKQLIEQKTGEMRAGMERLMNANQNYDTEMGVVESESERTKVLQNLENATNLFGKIVGKISSGLQFYNNLSRHLTVIQQSVSDFIYARNIEKNDLIARLSSQGNFGVHQPSQGYPYHNPYGSR